MLRKTKLWDNVGQEVKQISFSTIRRKNFQDKEFQFAASWPVVPLHIHTIDMHTM